VPFSELINVPYDVVISVLSPDRVGIIAAVTRAVYELGGNVDAMSETVMRGYFTFILTVRFPDRLPLDGIRQRIASTGHPDELSVSIQERRAEAPAPGGAEGEEFVLTIMGEDRPGIISRISQYLAGRGINIQDLYASAEGDRFMLVGQVTVPRQRDIRQVQIDLEALWPGGTHRVSLQHVDIFVATNEIDFRQRHARLRAGGARHAQD
jgi:glycine cleavage system transcriptional repressor